MSMLALGICLVLFLLWKLDFVASLLNIKALEPELPEEFKDVFDAKKYAESQQYARENERVGIIESVISLTLLLVFWFSGGFQLLDAWVRGFELNMVFTGVAYIGIFLSIQFIVAIPMSLYNTFVLEEKYGFNKTTIQTYIIDQVKNILLGAIIMLPIIAIILWIFESVPMAWLWAWAAFTIIQLALTYIAPSLILPLYNKFEPMPDGELKSAIEAMAKDCDFPLAGLYVMDGSKRTAKSNAFFTGFGKTKKIALYDTLIEKHTTEELVGVLAHEIGHFQCKHIVKRMITGFVKMAAIFFLLGIVTNKDYAFTRLLFDAFYVENISTHVGLILFFILFTPVSRVLGVFGNISSRKHEFEADAYASKAQKTSSHMIAALKKLSLNNLSNLTPHRLTVFLDHSHPPVLQRILALKKL